MNINFVWVGATGNRDIRALCDEYTRRIGFFAKVNTQNIKEEKSKSKYSANHIKERESNKLVEVLDKKHFNIALHPEGKLLSSEKFACLMNSKIESSWRNISFFIGGELGLSEEFMKKCDLVLSLSKMTYTHELARIVLCEQVYRAFTIMNGTNYHK